MKLSGSCDRIASVKKALKILSFVFVAVLIPVWISGCSNAGQSNVDGKTVKDSYERQVNVPEKVERIATVGSATRIVVYAGAVEKLVAITEVDKPSELRPYTIAYSEEFEKLPTTNNGNHLNSTTVDREKMLSVKPDVIFSSRSADECEKLQNDLKIPVVGVFFQDEIFSENVTKAIEICGEISGTSNKANETNAYLKNIQNEMEKLCTGNSDSIYRGAINYKGSKDLTGTISNYCVYQAIKANSVSERNDINGAYDTTLEQILTWNPKVVVMDYSNKEKVKNQMDSNKEVFEKLNAFKNDQTYFVAPFNNNGTNIEYGLCEMWMTAKILYPEKFSDVNLDEKFCEIYEKLLGKNIKAELEQKGVYFGKANF